MGPRTSSTTLLTSGSRVVAWVDGDPSRFVRLELNAEGGTGSVTLSGATEAEGTVDSLTVGDPGEITASGTVTVADDRVTEQASFDVTGNCA